MNRYFAYGSNMDPDQIGGRCPSARLVGPARLIDFRLAFTRESKVTFPGSGVADVVPAPGSVVWGAVYSMTEADLEALDRLEGAGTAYAREEVDVVDADGRIITAFTYVVIRKSEHEIRPSAEYMERVIAGARACGLSRDHIELLNSIRDQPLGAHHTGATVHARDGHLG